EAPVAVYMDNAYIASINGVSGQLFDTERVEVLRGPQGTLFGRNATGGLIHYISRDASDAETNGYLTATAGNFARYEVEGAFGGSLSDRARARVAARYATADGYVESADAIPGVLTGSGQDIGGEDGWAVRGTLQVDFTDNLTGDFWLKYSEDNDVPTGGYVFANCVFEANGYCNVDDAGLGAGDNGVINGITGEPASPFENFGEQPGFFNRETGIAQAEFEYGFDNGMTLTSITNYTDLDKSYLEDGDAIPVLVINFANAVDYKQFSQELRLSGSTDRMNWQTGFYYLDFEIDGSITTQGAPVLGAALDNGLPGVDPRVDQLYVLDSRNYSVFGQVEYDILPDVTLIGGLRYSKDDKSIDYESSLTEGAASLPLGSDEQFAEAIPGIDEIDYGDVAARAGVNWRPNEDTLVFASYNRGIKGGNWTLANDLTPENFQHDEEILDAYEIGVKSELLQQSLRLNATLFYYDYTDYQAFAVTGGTPQVTNSDASSTGGEIELFWSPSPNFDVVLGGTFQESSVDEVNGPGEQFGPDFTGGLGPQTVGACELGDGFYFCDYPQDTIQDAEFPNAPSYSLNYLVRYNVDGLAGNIALQVDGVWYDDQFLEVTNGLSSLQEAYGLTNASATWSTLDGGYEVQVFGKNVFDEEYAAYSLNLGILGTTQFYGAPATYGVTLRKRW
ncbi:MAG: TonB-dependent receptor, partial [Caulobacterales bacterium]|nr:TonB-dependent receptor [Caulobacterales bacterium]